MRTFEVSWIPKKLRPMIARTTAAKMPMPTSSPAVKSVALSGPSSRLSPPPRSETVPLERSEEIDDVAVRIDDLGVALVPERVPRRGLRRMPGGRHLRMDGVDL